MKAPRLSRRAASRKLHGTMQLGSVRPPHRNEREPLVVGGKELHMEAMPSVLKHLTLGILRHFNQFSTPRQNPALKQTPRPPQRR
jgi:hypothetical protein